MIRRALSLIPLLVACSSTPGGQGTGGAGGEGTTTSTTTSSGSTSASTSTTTSSSGSTTSSSGSTTSSSGSTTSSSSSGAPCASALPEYTNGNGSVTYYTLAMGSTAVNCSFDVLGQDPDVIAHVATGGGKLFGAMNTADYDTAAACGACVEVTRDGAKKVVITIVDQCPTPTNPKCTAGHIDLSEEAFAQIGTLNEGYLGTGNGAAVGSISWRYVPCPVTENVSFRLKEPTNEFWNQILVEGHRHAVEKLEVMVNGNWVAAVRQSYNYWQAGNGNMGKAPYQVRVTDANGDVITASLDLVDGDQMGTQQFAACQ